MLIGKRFLQQILATGSCNRFSQAIFDSDYSQFASAI